MDVNGDKLIGLAFTMQMQVDAVLREITHRKAYHALNQSSPVNHILLRKNACGLGPRAEAAWRLLDQSLTGDVDSREAASMLLKADFTVDQAADMMVIYIAKAEALAA